MAEDSYLRRLFNFIFGWGKPKESPTTSETHEHFEALTHYHFHDRPMRITTEVVWLREAASEAIPTVVEEEIHLIPTRPIDNAVEFEEHQYEGEVQEAVPETDRNGEDSTSDAAAEEYEAATAIRVESTTPRIVRFSNIPPRLEEKEDRESEAPMAREWITHEPIAQFQPFNQTTAAHCCSSECISFAAFGLPTEFICTHAYYPQEDSYNVWPSQVIANSVRSLSSVSAAPEIQSSVPSAHSEAPIWNQPDPAYPQEQLYFVAPHKSSSTLELQEEPIDHEVEVEDVIDELPYSTVVDDSRCRCTHSQSEYLELSATLECLPAMITGALRDFHSSAKRESCHSQPQPAPKPLPTLPDEERPPTPAPLVPLPQASAQYPLHSFIGHGGWTHLSPPVVPTQFPSHYHAHHIPLCYTPLYLLSGAGHCRAHETSLHAERNTGIVGHATPGSQDPAGGARMNPNTESEPNHRPRNDEVQLREILVHSSLPDGHADYTQARAVYRRTRVQRLKRSLRLANGEDLRKIALSITPTLAAVRD